MEGYTDSSGNRERWKNVVKEVVGWLWIETDCVSEESSVEAVMCQQRVLLDSIVGPDTIHSAYYSEIHSRTFDTVSLQVRDTAGRYSGKYPGKNTSRFNSGVLILPCSFRRRWCTVQTAKLSTMD